MGDHYSKVDKELITQSKSLINKLIKIFKAKNVKLLQSSSFFFLRVKNRSNRSGKAIFSQFLKRYADIR